MERHLINTHTHNSRFYRELNGPKLHVPNTVLAPTVKIRKSLALISGSPGDQIFSLTFRNSTEETV